MKSKSSPLSWIPTLYVAEGIPYVVVMTLALVMYKSLGMSNSDAALYTSWLYLPWVIKPFWSPIVDIFKQKRWWILTMQLLIGTSLAGVALTLDAPSYVQWTLALFWLMAFSSATHDIAADGFYMIALSQHDQSLYVGIRSTFYRLATIGTQGGLLVLVDYLQKVGGFSPKYAWQVTFALTATFFIIICIWHFIFLPRVEKQQDVMHKESDVMHSLGMTIISFIQKPQFFVAIAFMLLYRFPEALLVKISPLFLLDTIEAGGLAMSKTELGLVQGTVGVIGLTLGGIVGGIVIARDGFKKWLWWMVASITIPHALYVMLAYFLPSNIILISTAVFIEQFGYGFGFTAYMLYMIYFSIGPSKTSHYAFCTGFMALSMMLPGMIAGWLQEQMGYLWFFVLVLALTPLTCIAAYLIKIDPNFGKKEVGKE